MQEEGGAANTDLRVNLYHWAGLPSAKLLSVDPSCLQVHVRSIMVKYANCTHADVVYSGLSLCLVGTKRVNLHQLTFPFPAGISSLCWYPIHSY